MREGDVILEVDRKPIASSEDAARLLGTQRCGGHLLRVMRGEAAIFIVIPQLLAVSLLAWLLDVFANGDPSFVFVIGAIGWLLAGLAVLRVRDTASTGFAR